MRRLLGLILISSLALCGCKGGSKAESKEAIQKAVEAYIAQRQNLTLANMSLEVAEVKFEGETAAAEVKFRSKQSSSLVVTIHYKLKRQGDGWQVETSSPASGSSGSPHGTIPPSGAPPAHGETPLEPSH